MLVFFFKVKSFSIEMLLSPPVSYLGLVLQFSIFSSKVFSFQAVLIFLIFIGALNLFYSFNFS